MVFLRFGGGVHGLGFLALPETLRVDGGTLNFLALYISSILESLNFLGPGC